MSLERMELDFYDCITTPLSVLDKLALAACCTKIRVALSPLFEEWDHEFATLCSLSIQPNDPNCTFLMKHYDKHNFDLGFARNWWPTTQATIPPSMTFVYNRGGCMAFEHGHMEMDVTYRLDPIEDPTRDKVHEGKEVHCASPLLWNARFEPLKTISKVPAMAIVWNVHHHKKEMGVGYFIGNPVVQGDDRVVYVRTHNLVSVDVSTDNPRVSLELMGVSILDRNVYNESNCAFGCRAHINMKQLRIYVKKPSLTHAMKKRAMLSAPA